MEKVTNLDETGPLGYFESIRGVFLLKIAFLSSFTKEHSGKRTIDATRLPPDIIGAMEVELDDPAFYAALRNGNEEIYLNYFDEMITSVINSSWNVFEQIIKDSLAKNYSTNTDDISVGYQSGKFQFTDREKKDIDLFYYVRNAICHHNGAYYASKSIRHRFNGTDFVSYGHEGEKIYIKTKTAWEICRALEGYTLKAWANARQFKSQQ